MQPAAFPLSRSEAGGWHFPAHLPAAAAYSVTARMLHWITAGFILLMIPLGVIIANEWGGSRQSFLYDCTGPWARPLFRYSWCA